MRKLIRSIVHRYDNLGMAGLLGLRRMPALPIRNQLPHPFDPAHDCDTGGFQAGETLVTGSSADLYNTAYYAISPSTLAAALRLIPTPLDQYTLVDLGCGKGRALLVAAAFPFAHIVGVELVAALAEIARRNTVRDARIRILNQDAAHVIYPAGALVVFLYHPFLKPVLRRALLNLREQLRREPRPLWLLYANPSYPGLIERTGFLEEVWDRQLPLSAEDAAADRHGITSERYTLYRSVLSSAG